MQHPIEQNDPKRFSSEKENQYFDCKSARKDANDISRHISAFANASGGKLVIGIEDDGEITGFRRRGALNLPPDAVYFEYSYNLVHLLQSKDRIHRLGLPDDQKTRYYFMREKFMRDGRELSLDAVIYDRLKEKEQTMLDAIDRGCLEGGYLDDEDLRIIFERLLGGDAKGLEY